MASCEHVVCKEQGDLCTGDREGKGKSVYGRQRRNRENSVVQAAGKEQAELCGTGCWETERTVYMWQGSNWENCVQVAGKEQ